MKSSILSSVLALTPSALATFSKPEGHDIQYSSVPGYFLQDDPNTNPNGFDYSATPHQAQWNFGLVNRTYPTDDKFDPQHTKTQWQRFERWVKYLNSNCRKCEKATYKVFFFGRHGEGYHNVAESFYGTPAWNCYWAELNSNGTSTWADALLTDNGFAQASKANAYYKSRFEQEGLPYFESYYSSPLRRCIQTANTTFATLDLPHTHPFEPTIKELFREGISIHTCDHRSTKTEIHGFAPAFKFEAGFSEQDELWRGNVGEGETSAHQMARSKVALDDVFTHDNGTWISVSSHSGEIGSLLTVLNHQPFGLATGQIIPVLVKAEIVEPLPTTTYASFTHEATCTSPPVTSVAGQGCVCSTTAAPAFSSTTLPAAH
ncbi:putative phosphoglycerate mutase [Cladobotryum mycophilum]|uniref:Phosphoglycerate mutase n=1 Tax=Cladobotryum mycophilum TaxID=491253 RepID=A0ABR0SK27_9HYPO